MGGWPNSWQGCSPHCINVLGSCCNKDRRCHHAHAQKLRAGVQALQKPAHRLKSLHTWCVGQCVAGGLPHEVGSRWKLLKRSKGRREEWVELDLQVCSHRAVAHLFACLLASEGHSCMPLLDCSRGCSPGLTMAVVVVVVAAIAHVLICRCHHSWLMPAQTR